MKKIKKTHMKYTKESIEKMTANELRDIYIKQQEVIEKLENENRNLESENRSLENEKHNLELRVDWLTEQITKSKQKTYGRRADNASCQLMMIFNEAEGTYEIVDQQGEKEEPNIEVVVPSYKRRPRKKGKRIEDLSGLPVKRVNHEIPKEDLETIFDGRYRKLKDDIYQTLEYHPATFEVLEHHIAVYAGKKDGEEKVVRADHPAELLKHSVATPSLAAAVMNAKYVNAVPIRRIEAELSRMNIQLSEQVMSGWMIKFAERYLSLVYERLHKELMSSHVVHADETPVLVNKDGRKAGSKSYMWVYCSEGERTITLYDYERTRGGIHPESFLKDYRGYLVTDGYSAYHKLDKENPNLTVAGCWAHCQRKFTDILKSGKASPTSISAIAVSQIKNIYHMDNKLKDLPPKERLNERNIVVKPLVEAFFVWAKEKRSQVLNRAGVSDALDYAINQEEYLKRFLDDSEIPLDNNAAERKIRPFTVGRKNWQMIDTIHGANASAVIYSIAETAKANNLKPYEYFKHLLTEIPKHMDDTTMEFLEELMPWSDTLPAECR